MFNRVEFKNIRCPYCGELVQVQVDGSQGEHEFIEDCEVCCRPIQLLVFAMVGDDYQLSVRSEDEG